MFIFCPGIIYYYYFLSRLSFQSRKLPVQKTHISRLTALTQIRDKIIYNRE